MRERERSYVLLHYKITHAYHHTHHGLNPISKEHELSLKLSCALLLINIMKCHHLNDSNVISRKIGTGELSATVNRQEKSQP